ncbi:hypothetical protein B0H34DRAFT_715829 [Crassisporium funariophilum]|nr:hypothetical protein B0H34DRAFT_715829 [Crassisporium funariophilum]
MGSDLVRATNIRQYVEGRDKEAITPLLGNLGLDLQIYICNFLHPLDILALSRTCTSFKHSTSQRIVWIEALGRVIRSNLIFPPTFPISSMSYAELAMAATAPKRWVTTSSSQRLNADETLLNFEMRSLRDHPACTPLPLDFEFWDIKDVYLVPGGRYMVTFAQEWIAVWDLGVPSIGAKSANGKLIGIAPADVADEYRVHATPDGLGLRIFTETRMHNKLYIFEMYPESDDPKLVRIAFLEGIRARDANFSYFLTEDRLVCLEHDSCILTIWDYILNIWTSWCVKREGPVEREVLVLATGSAIAITHPQGISIWPMPPLTCLTPLFVNDVNPPELAPTLHLEYPGEYVMDHQCILQGLGGWYFGHSASLSTGLYYDVIDPSLSKIRRFQITLNPDLTEGAITLLNTIQMPVLSSNPPSYHSHRICEDTLVACWVRERQGGPGQTIFQAYTASIAPPPCAHPSQTINNLSPLCKYYQEICFCPTSSRLVYLDFTDWGPDIIIVDFDHIS